MTYVLAVPAGAFKLCCLSSGRYDGAIRNHYFLGMKKMRGISDMSRLFTTRLFEMNPRGAVRRGGFGSSSSATFTFCHSRLPAAKNPNPSAKARSAFRFCPQFATSILGESKGSK